MSLTPEEQRALAIECGGIYGTNHVLFHTNSTDSLAAYTAAVEAKRGEEVSSQFNGFDISKLPAILISLSAKLFNNGGIFWEVTIDSMPSRVETLKSILESRPSLEELTALLAKEREKVRVEMFTVEECNEMQESAFAAGRAHELQALREQKPVLQLGSPTLFWLCDNDKKPPVGTRFYAAPVPASEKSP